MTFPAGGFPSAQAIADFTNRDNPVTGVNIDVSSADVDLTSVLAPCATALYVGVTGDVTATLATPGSATTVDVLYKAVPVGTVLRGLFLRVRNSGTTASHIVALQ